MPSPSSSFRTSFLRIYLPLLLIAGVARLIGIGRSLAYDEIFFLIQFVNRSFVSIFTTDHFANFHILYALLSNLVVKATGHHWIEFTMRLVAVASGIISVPALVWAVRPVVSKRIAVVAALLLSFWPLHISLSQDAKAYTLMVLMAILCVGFVVRYLETPRPRFATAMFMFALLGLYSHPYFAVFLGGLFLWAAIEIVSARNCTRSQWRFLLAACGAFVLLAVMLYWPHFRIYRSYNAGMSASPEQYDWPMWRGLVLGLGGGTYGSTILVMAALAGGLPRASRSIRRFILLQFLASGTWILVLRPAFLTPRFFSYLIAFLLVIIAGSIIDLASRFFRKRPAWGAAVAIAILGAAMSPVLWAYYRVPKQDYRGVAQFIAAAEKDRELVCSAGFGGDLVTFYYRDSLVYIHDKDHFDRILGRCREQRRNLLFVLVYEYLNRDDPVTRPIVQKVMGEFECLKVFESSTHDGEIRVYRFVPPRPRRAGSVMGEL